MNHFPEQYKLHPDLANILGIKEESRLGVIQALWSYIKLNGLQDNVRVAELDWYVPARESSCTLS